MKRVFSLLFATFLLTAKLFAGDCCFQIAGEWLYMLSAVDQPYYTVEQGTVVGGQIFNGDRIPNKQKWHSGWRVEATYYLPCCDYLRARWTGFNNNKSDSDTTNVPNFPILQFPVGGLFTEASIRHRFNFNYVDAVYGRTVYCCCPVIITLEGGIQYVNLHFKERATYNTGGTAPILSRVNNHSHLQGVGPELGLRFDYRFGKCFALVSRTTGAFVVSNKHARFRQQTAGIVTHNTKNKDFWFATPTWDTRLGLNYSSQFNCFCFCGCFELEAGYEFIHVHHGFDRIYFVDTVSIGQSFTQHQDFTLHGPYVRLGVCF